MQQQKEQPGTSGVQAADAQLAALQLGNFNADWPQLFDLATYADRRNNLGAPSNQATVFKDDHRLPGFPLAIRRFALSQNRQTDAWGNQERERAVLKELEILRRASNHPLFVPVYSWTVAWRQERRRYFLDLYTVMPRINGDTLQDLCQTWDGSAQQPLGGLRDDAIRKQWKMLDLELCLALNYLHRQGVAHGSPHERNILLEKVQKKTEERHVRLIDLGRYTDLNDARITKQAKDDAKARDVRFIAVLHLYAMYGFRMRGTAIPDEILNRMFPGETADTEEKKREKLFVLGVLGDSEHRLEAHHVLGFPHFEGVEDKKGKEKTTPVWATELPANHQFAPTTGSLRSKFEAGDGTLKLRAGMADELEHFEVANVAGHAKFVYYPSLAAFACKQAADEATTNKDCPVGTLYDMKHAEAHAHDEHGKPFGSEPRSRKPTAESDEERFSLTTGLGSGGGFNYLFTEKVELCNSKLNHKPRHWLNAKVGHNQQTGRHYFLLAPGKNCDDKTEDVPKFHHLAQLVEPVKTRPDRVEPWTALVTYCSDTKNPDETKAGKLQSKEGMTWIEPTHANFKEIGNTAKKPKKQPESQPKTPPATKPAKKGPGKKK